MKKDTQADAHQREIEQMMQEYDQRNEEKELFATGFLGSRHLQGFSLSDSDEESSAEKQMFELYGKDGLANTLEFKSLMKSPQSQLLSPQLEEEMLLESKNSLNSLLYKS